MKKTPLFILIILIFLTNYCSNPIKNCDMQIVSINKKTSIKVTCDTWRIIMPEGWRLYKKNNSPDVNFIHLKRYSLKNRSISDTANCLIQYKELSKKIDLNKYVLKNFTLITAQLIRSGFIINKNRDDIFEHLKRSNKKIILSGFSYEFTHKNKKQIAISCFTRNSKSILNLSFEMTPQQYQRLKKEISGIMHSMTTH